MSWLDEKNFMDNRSTKQIKLEFKIWVAVMVLLAVTAKIIVWATS